MTFWDEIKMATCERLVAIIISLVPDCPEGNRLVVYLDGWLEECIIRGRRTGDGDQIKKSPPRQASPATPQEGNRKKH